jgi:hypothetical protein
MHISRRTSAGAYQQMYISSAHQQMHISRCTSADAHQQMYISSAHQQMHISSAHQQMHIRRCTSADAHQQTHISSAHQEMHIRRCTSGDAHQQMHISRRTSADVHQQMHMPLPLRGVCFLRECSHRSGCSVLPSIVAFYHRQVLFTDDLKSFLLPLFSLHFSFTYFTFLPILFSSVGHTFFTPRFFVTN